MNIAVILAGGVGKRMNPNGIPKQFLKINDVPIIIHTLLIFQECEEVDGVIITCVKEYMEYLKNLIEQYKITKVLEIVEGGETNQLSSYNGVMAANKFVNKNEKNIIVMHDGVRPIIDSDLIKRNIETARKFGAAISCAQSKETTVIADGTNGEITNITERQNTYIARAPQTFLLDELTAAHKKAHELGETNMIDACSVMNKFSNSCKMHIVKCSSANIKITTPDDFYVAEALIKSKKAKQVLGV